MKINTTKTKVMKIAKERETSLNIYIDGSQLEEVVSFRYLGSHISNDGMCTNDINAKIGAAKTAFYKNKCMQFHKISVRLRDRLAKCYIWSIATYASETCTLRAEEKRKLDCFQRRIWKKLLGIRWRDRISNELLQTTMPKDASLHCMGHVICKRIFLGVDVKGLYLSCMWKSRDI